MTTQDGAATSAQQDPAGAEVVLSAERWRHDVVRVPRERVRISKRVTTEVRTLEVPVRVEQLVVRHEPLDGAQPGATGEDAPPEELVLVLHEEVPVVSVEVRAVERVRVRVRRVEGHQAVSGFLSHEEAEVSVEEVPPAGGASGGRATGP